MQPDALRSTCSCVSTVMLRGGAVVCATCSAPVVAAAGMTSRAATRTVYSQRDGERPTGAGRVKYLRVWSVANAADSSEAWAEGRARLMSAEAWRRHQTPQRRHAKVTPAQPVTLGVLEVLGLERAS